jgi:hypothetical protein
MNCKIKIPLTVKTLLSTVSERAATARMNRIQRDIPLITKMKSQAELRHRNHLPKCCLSAFVTIK